MEAADTGSKRRHFSSDNYSGICPEVWQRCKRPIAGTHPGYGEDPWPNRACKMIRDVFRTGLRGFLCRIARERDGWTAGAQAAANCARRSARDGFPFATYAAYAVLFDRIFRFPITGPRVRNYDALGGQLLFSYLHQKDVLIWRDNRLTIKWEPLPDAASQLREAHKDRDQLRQVKPLLDSLIIMPKTES